MRKIRIFRSFWWVRRKALSSELQSAVQFSQKRAQLLEIRFALPDDNHVDRLNASHSHVRHILVCFKVSRRHSILLSFAKLFQVVQLDAGM